MQPTDSVDTNDDPSLDDIDDTDYIFVVDASGNLKSICLPEGFEEITVPETVTKIIEIFDVGTFYSGTIH